MAATVLNCHPRTPCSAVTRIEVRAEFRTPAHLTLRYRFAGEISRVRIPPALASERTDQLWRHTCCEAFIRHPAGSGYWEYNLSPSTQWAIYRFEGYRRGMRNAEGAGPENLSVRSDENRLDVEATLDLRHLPRPPGRHPVRLALCAVIEELDSRLSYWAIQHPPGQPDFHHPEGFALQLLGGD